MSIDVTTGAASLCQHRISALAGITNTWYKAEIQSYYIHSALQRNDSNIITYCVNVHVHFYTWMCAGFSLYVQSPSACLAHHAWWLIVEGSPTSWTWGQVGHCIFLLLLPFGLFYSIIPVTVPLSCSSVYVAGFTHSPCLSCEYIEGYINNVPQCMGYNSRKGFKTRPSATL